MDYEAIKLTGGFFVDLLYWRYERHIQQAAAGLFDHIIRTGLAPSDIRIHAILRRNRHVADIGDTPQSRI